MVQFWLDGHMRSGLLIMKVCGGKTRDVVAVGSWQAGLGVGSSLKSLSMRVAIRLVGTVTNTAKLKSEKRDRAVEGQG